jgi:hypothetical protein
VAREGVLGGESDIDVGFDVQDTSPWHGESLRSKPMSKKSKKGSYKQRLAYRRIMIASNRIKAELDKDDDCSPDSAESAKTEESTDSAESVESSGPVVICSRLF